MLLRVKSAHVRSLPFTDANINPGHPDFYYIQTKIQKALTPPAPAKAKPAGTSAGSGTSTGGSKTSPTPTTSTTTSDPGAAVDVKEVC